MESTNSCLYPVQDQKTLASTRMRVGLLAIVFCGSTLFALCCIEGRNLLRGQFIQRQFMYLSVVNIVNCLSFIMQYVEFNQDDAKQYCSWVAFFVQVTSCLQLYTVLWVACNIYATFSPKKYGSFDQLTPYDLNDSWMKICERCKNKLLCVCCRNKLCVEVVSIIAIVFCSVGLSVFPWIKHGYGIFANGGLCWIRGTKNCIYYGDGVAMQWIFWYAQEGLIGIVVIPVLLLVTFYRNCKNYCVLNKERESLMVKESKRDCNLMGVVLVTYLIGYFVLILTEIVTMIVVMVHHKTKTIGNETLALWIVYTVVVPGSVGLLPLTFSLCSCVKKRYHNELTAYERPALMQ